MEKLEAERKAAIKRAQEAELARLKAEKERLEKEAAQKAKEEQAQAAEAEVVSGVDINITQEELEAKRKADALMQEAIREVDQED